MAKLLRATLLDKFMDAFIEWPHDERLAMISNLQSADALLMKIEKKAAAAKPEPKAPEPVDDPEATLFTEAVLKREPSPEEVDGIRRD